MTHPVQDQYPHDLAGAATTPPEAAPADLVQAWREYLAEEAAELADGPLVAASANWREARSLEVLLAEADAANSKRDRRSDGALGDARHRALGKSTDHNPWVIVAGVGVVRARDFDADGLDLAGAFERMRVAAYKDPRHPLRGGGYLIHAGRITAPDFSEWREYKGENPHIPYGHVSVSTDRARFDSDRPWNVWTAPRPTTPRATPTTPRQDPPRATRDLRGRGLQLRGELGNAGPRVRELQRFLGRVHRGAYAELAADGQWGRQTAGALAHWSNRVGVPGADGRNIGPRLARKLAAGGFRG